MTDAQQSTVKRSWLDIAVPALLVAGTAATRMPRLSDPRAFVFDEIYYAPDAAEMLRRGVEKGGVVHPPAGKWLIAIGIRLFGFTPFGWRFAALVCGCIIVLLTYIAARQFVSGRLVPAVAAGAVALDGVSFTTGRTAHLDVFLALFTTLAITLTLVALRDPTNQKRVRWCMVGSGVALGLGLAVKWSAGFLLLGVLLAFLWMRGREAATPGHGKRIFATVLTLTVLPVGVYLAAYTPWIVNFDKTYIHIVRCRNNNECSESLTERIRLFLRDQDRIRQFQQSSLQEGNSNADLSWKWINQMHPSTLFRKTCTPQLNQAPNDLADQSCAGAKPGDIVEIVTVANPIVWFAGMGAGLILAWRAVFRRDRLAFFLLAFGLYQWLPWAINPRHSYTFYIAPLIPAIALWIAAVLAKKPFKWLLPAFAVLTVVAFAFYYPIWAGKPMSPDQIRAREYWRAY
ncbi:MAG TPA: phospholipid carrier-dependent glycosyltransferase [Acidimicrobiales bacterium]|nr:phospholipid carrier-dependent glycosyltransferase [Acidimicrobiales bacterium]